MNWTTPTCSIWDIDGTLANIEHRRHWVQNKPKNWKAFSSSMHLDTPYTDIVWMLRRFHESNVTILIASGRSEDDRAVTVNWLDNVAGLKGVYSRLYMRASRDYRSDDIVKSEILDQMVLDGYNPTIAVDDRQQVVDMWRSRGLRVLQVAPGNF